MYYAVLCTVTDEPEDAEDRWRVTDEEDDCVVDKPDGSDLYFASEIDCQLACKSFNDAGMDWGELLELSDEEFGKLVTRYLRW